MIRNRPVSLALVGLFVWLTACTSYKQIGIREVADHAKVRITLTNGQRETVRDPRVEGDSITFQVKEGRPTPQRVDRSLALARVVKFEAVGTDEVATVFLVLGIVVAVGAAVIYIACSNTSGICFNVY